MIPAAPRCSGAPIFKSAWHTNGAGLEYAGPNPMSPMSVSALPLSVTGGDEPSPTVPNVSEPTTKPAGRSFVIVVRLPFGKTRFSPATGIPAGDHLPGCDQSVLFVPVHDFVEETAVSTTSLPSPP